MASHVNRAYVPAAWWGRGASAALALSACASASGLWATPAAAAPPEIRTSAKNAVPACVTAQRLMSFLKSRNPSVDRRFADIANLYKRHGERWRVRWDYAFYQMAVETNFLSYKQGNGRWGDVDPKQNNFAGLGTTGGGVAGDSYPDVTTGVLAQIQHLVAYSGEHIDNPVGARTKLKQDDIIEQMARFKGHATFNDLSRRWAVDRHYGAAIEWVANGYRAVYCKPGSQRAEGEPVQAERVSEAEAPAQTDSASGEEAQPTAAVEVASAHTPEPALPPAEALGGPPAPTQATKPAAETEAESPVVLAAATPEPAAAAGVARPEAATKNAATIVPVRTIWSRDKQEAPIPAPVPKGAATQRMAPLPIAKAKLAPGLPPVVATAEAPAATNHVPEELPVEEPKPAVVTMPATAAIDAKPAAAPALERPLELRAFAFAPAINLAELGPRPQPRPEPGATCRVLTASYGGKKTLLVRTKAGTDIHYTALTVLEGFEGSMLDNFLKAHAPGGSSIGEYESKDAALAKARELCPGSAAAPKVEGASAG